MVRRLALLVFLAVLVVPSVVQASPGPRFHIMHNAFLVDDGEGVTAQVMITCPEGMEILEGFFYVVQDGEQSHFAGVSVPCDGRPHRIQRTASAMEGESFHAGMARISGYLLVMDENGNTESVSPGRNVRILG